MFLRTFIFHIGEEDQRRGFDPKVFPRTSGKLFVRPKRANPRLCGANTSPDPRNSAQSSRKRSPGVRVLTTRRTAKAQHGHALHVRRTAIARGQNFFWKFWFFCRAVLYRFREGYFVRSLCDAWPSHDPENSKNFLSVRFRVGCFVRWLRDAQPTHDHQIVRLSVPKRFDSSTTTLRWSYLDSTSISSLLTHLNFKIFLEVLVWLCP